MSDDFDSDAVGDFYAHISRRSHERRAQEDARRHEREMRRIALMTLADRGEMLAFDTDPTMQALRPTVHERLRDWVAEFGLAGTVARLKAGPRPDDPLIAALERLGERPETDSWTARAKEAIPRIIAEYRRMQRSGKGTPSRSAIARRVEVNRDTIADWIANGWLSWPPETPQD